MLRKLLTACAIVPVFTLALTSCSSHQPVQEPQQQRQPVSTKTVPVGKPVESQQQAVTQEPAAVSRVDSVLEKVLSEATLLRTDGQRLFQENELEEARKTLDEALNIILDSGLALDAHPRLADLFKEISREVIQIEDRLAQADADVEETTLADELEQIEEVSEVGETESAPAEITYDYPVVLNNRVEQFIKLYQTQQRAPIAAGIARSGQFIERFREIFAEEGIPQDLVYLAMVESTYKVRAYSRAKAKGIWQFMSWTGKRYGLRIDSWVDERSDPYKSCRAAARFLRDLYNELGDWYLAMAAYNGGPGRVSRAVKSMGTSDFWTLSSSTRYLRRETRNFVPAILAATIILKEPAKYGFGDVVLDKPWEFNEVKISSPTDLNIIADLAGVSVNDLLELNPALRRKITPADYRDFKLKVPASADPQLEEKIAALPMDKRMKFAEHVVQRGQTLSVIARRYGTSTSAIQQANGITNPRRLQLGMRLIVPLSPGYAEAVVESDSSGDSARYAVGEKVSHQVRRGESLYSIARRYGTTVGSIATWNKLNPRSPIHPGDRLDVYANSRARGVPDDNERAADATRSSGGKVVHSVRRGDTLYSIANRYKTTVAMLKRWNNLSRNLIKPGDRLTVYTDDSSDSN